MATWRPPSLPARQPRAAWPGALGEISPADRLLAEHRAQLRRAGLKLLGPARERGAGDSGLVHIARQLADRYRDLEQLRRGWAVVKPSPAATFCASSS